MPPIGPEHAETTSKLNELLVLRFAGRARVTVGNPAENARFLTALAEVFA